MSRSPEYIAALAHSLEWDDERHEPYLQLPSFPDLRLTPFREGIEEDLVTMFNIEEIANRLYRLPKPLTRAYADEWVATEVPTARGLVAPLVARREADPAEALPATTLPDTPIVGFPFKSLRSVSLGRNLGDINLSPDQWVPKAVDDGVPGYTTSTTTRDDVLARARADQTWMIGYVLDPCLKGKGVMSEIVGCVIEGWVKPFMGVGKLAAFAEFNNHGSLAVLRKNGFSLVGRETSPWPIEKGGGTRETGRYERNLLLEYAV